MTEPLNTLGALTLFVDDPQQSKAFYARVFGTEPMFEDENAVAVKFDNVVLNFLKRGAAVDDLLGPVPAAPAGASFLLTVWVEDVDAVCADLGSRGITVVHGPIDRAWGMRTASFTDPDGYLWEVAANIPSA
jgi:catechol 2,3-dioxygenase-like lactoylglutathione lyase family enzyme